MCFSNKMAAIRLSSSCIVDMLVRDLELLHQVSVSLSEWRELLLLPQAWTLFMQRCFSAYLEVGHVQGNCQGHVWSFLCVKVVIFSV